jgi:hypothetical protein
MPSDLIERGSLDNLAISSNQEVGALCRALIVVISGLCCLGTCLMHYQAANVLDRTMLKRRKDSLLDPRAYREAVSNTDSLPLERLEVSQDRIVIHRNGVTGNQPIQALAEPRVLLGRFRPGLHPAKRLGRLGQDTTAGRPTDSSGT